MQQARHAPFFFIPLYLSARADFALLLLSSWQRCKRKEEHRKKLRRILCVVLFALRFQHQNTNSSSSRNDHGFGFAGFTGGFGTLMVITFSFDGETDASASGEAGVRVFPARFVPLFVPLFVYLLFVSILPPEQTGEQGEPPCSQEEFAVSCAVCFVTADSVDGFADSKSITFLCLSGCVLLFSGRGDV